MIENHTLTKRLLMTIRAKLAEVFDALFNTPAFCEVIDSKYRHVYRGQAGAIDYKYHFVANLPGGIYPQQAAMYVANNRATIASRKKEIFVLLFEKELKAVKQVAIDIGVVFDVSQFVDTVSEETSGILCSEQFYVFSATLEDMAKIADTLFSSIETNSEARAHEEIYRSVVREAE